MGDLWLKLNTYYEKTPGGNVKIVADILSALFIPFFYCIPYFLVLSNRVCSESDAPVIGFVTILFFTALPSLILAVYAIKKNIDMDFPNREDRLIPQLIAIVCYLAGILTLYALNAPDIIMGLALAYLFSTIALLVINMFWKISTHLTGAAGPVLFAAYQLGAVFLLLLLLLVVIGWARYVLGKHTVTQLVCGAALSLTVSAIIIAAMSF